MGGHSSRLEQAEDRISELEDEMEIKGKNWRTISQTTQDLWKEYARTLTPSIDQTWESWALKEKRCKQKEFVI
jgi:hypothetical protein